MTDPRLMGPRFGVPSRQRRWCPVHEVSALEDPTCWVAGCRESTITDADFRRLEAKVHMSTYGAVRQHGGERG